MANFSFSHLRLKQVAKNIQGAREPELFFHPTYRGGCLQVKDKKNPNYIQEVFATSQQGYEKLCEHLWVPSVSINPETIREILLTKSTLRVRVNKRTKTGDFVYKFMEMVR